MVKKEKEVGNNLPVRGAAYVFTAIESWILFYDTDFPVWLLILISLFSVIYPVVIFKLTTTKKQEIINVIIDSCVFSIYAFIWGLNPYLTFVLACSIALTTVSLSGVKHVFSTFILCSLSVFIFSIFFDFEYRETISIFNMLYFATSAILFMIAIGFMFYKINGHLARSKSRFYSQREHLKHINELALAVNATLELDALIEALSKSLSRHISLESIVITAFNDERTEVDVLSTYGGALTRREEKGLRSLKFPVSDRKQSLLLNALLDNEIVYYESVSEDDVNNFLTIDKMLYQEKPILSLAYFPIRVHGFVVAGVAFFNYEKPVGLSKKSINEIQSYLLQVGTALLNIRLFDRAKKEKLRAEESEKAKSHFLANMSHEIRTPMTAILGYSEALQDESISIDERKEFTQTIINGGHHLLSIINDILDISKIEADKIEVEMLDVNLPLLIKDLDSNIKLKAEEKSLNYKLNVNYPIPFDIRIDPTRIKQVLFNLASNAIKFTDKGSITVHVEWKKEGFLILSIEDTGIGLTKEEQEKLFQAFSQADSSTTRLYGGTGLGLYISKNLVQLMDGEIRIESEKGKGSKFIVELAMLHDITDSWISTEEDMQRCMAQLQDEKAVEYIPQLKGHILVADDTEQNQKLVRRLMEKTGVTVDVVNDGQEAFEQAQRSNYDLILLDIQMPIMGGSEAAEKIRSVGINTPLIAFTANVMQHQVEAYKQQNFDEVLEKPISRESLYRLLEGFLNHNHLHKILVVDDNKVNRMVLARYTSKLVAGVHIDQAEHGEEALFLLECNEYDLIFMDMEMPVMGGLEATECIRDRDIKTPIYMVTGNIDSSYVKKGKDAGADGHITKPIDREQLSKILERYI